MISANDDIAALYGAHLETMSKRLETALEATGFDALAILAGELKAPPRDDVTYPFRVEPHFAAWLPLIDVPGAALVLAPGRRPILLYPQLDDFWLAPAEPSETLTSMTWLPSWRRFGSQVISPLSGFIFMPSGKAFRE